MDTYEYVIIDIQVKSDVSAYFFFLKNEKI